MRDREFAKPPLRMDFGDGKTGTHTARFSEGHFDIYRMRPFAEHLPVREELTTNSSGLLESGNAFWSDRSGNPIEISDVVNNWEQAQNNPLWEEHITKIKNADLSYPIWVYGSGNEVIDGMHRLVHAVVNCKHTIKVQRWDELPEEAKLD